MRFVLLGLILTACGGGDGGGVTAPPTPPPPPPPPPPTTLPFVIASSTSSTCTFSTDLTLREAGPGRTLGSSHKTLAPGQADTIKAPADSPQLAILDGALHIAVYPYDVTILQTASVPGSATFALSGC